MTRAELLALLDKTQERLDHLEKHLHASNETTGCMTCVHQTRGY